MSISSGFDALQKVANASKESVAEGRKRRDQFRSALTSVSDVLEVVPSGSFARRTHKDPIHDIDLVVVFDVERFPEWGEPGDSAEAALEHTRGLVKDLLGPSGSIAQDVRWTRLNNHSVKCFLEDPDEVLDPFTVDCTPAVRRAAGGFWVPERNNRCWIASDPEDLIDRVAKRQSDWNEFTKLVRVLKCWSTGNGQPMKSLVVEVLALEHLRESKRPESLQRFFASASTAVLVPVCDPAGLCGEIDPDMDRQAASAVLSHAADLSWRAVDASGRGDEATAMCLWHQVFGDPYPEPTGGCSGSGSAVVGAAASAAAIATTVRRPKRPIRDAPQG
jgi:predicted nucleotidyltransferase